MSFADQLKLQARAVKSRGPGPAAVSPRQRSLAATTTPPSASATVLEAATSVMPSAVVGFSSSGPAPSEERINSFVRGVDGVRGRRAGGPGGGAPFAVPAPRLTLAPESADSDESGGGAAAPPSAAAKSANVFLDVKYPVLAAVVVDHVGEGSDEGKDITGPAESIAVAANKDHAVINILDVDDIVVAAANGLQPPVATDSSAQADESHSDAGPATCGKQSKEVIDCTVRNPAGELLNGVQLAPSTAGIPENRANCFDPDENDGSDGGRGRADPEGLSVAGDMSREPSGEHTYAWGDTGAPACLQSTEGGDEGGSHRDAAADCTVNHNEDVTLEDVCTGRIGADETNSRERAEETTATDEVADGNHKRSCDEKTEESDDAPDDCEIVCCPDTVWAVSTSTTARLDENASLGPYDSFQSPAATAVNRSCQQRAAKEHLSGHSDNDGDDSASFRDENEAENDDDDCNGDAAVFRITGDNSALAEATASASANDAQELKLQVDDLRASGEGLSDAASDGRKMDCCSDVVLAVGDSSAAHSDEKSSRRPASFKPPAAIDGDDLGVEDAEDKSHPACIRSGGNGIAGFPDENEAENDAGCEGDDTALLKCVVDAPAGVTNAVSYNDDGAHGGCTRGKTPDVDCSCQDDVAEESHFAGSRGGGNDSAASFQEENEMENDDECDGGTALLINRIDTLAEATTSVSSDNDGARGGCTGNEPPDEFAQDLQLQPDVPRAVEEEPSEIAADSTAACISAKAGVESDTDNDGTFRNEPVPLPAPPLTLAPAPADSDDTRGVAADPSSAAAKSATVFVDVKRPAHAEVIDNHDSEGSDEGKAVAEPAGSIAVAPEKYHAVIVVAAANVLQPPDATDSSAEADESHSDAGPRNNATAGGKQSKEVIDCTVRNPAGELLDRTQVAPSTAGIPENIANCFGPDENDESDDGRGRVDAEDRSVVGDISREPSGGHTYAWGDIGVLASLQISEGGDKGGSHEGAATGCAIDPNDNDVREGQQCTDQIDPETERSKSFREQAAASPTAEAAEVNRAKRCDEKKKEASDYASDDHERECCPDGVSAVIASTASRSDENVSLHPDSFHSPAVIVVDRSCQEFVAEEQYSDGGGNEDDAARSRDENKAEHDDDCSGAAVLLTGDIAPPAEAVASISGDDDGGGEPTHELAQNHKLQANGPTAVESGLSEISAEADATSDGRETECCSDAVLTIGDSAAAHLDENMSCRPCSFKALAATDADRSCQENAALENYSVGVRGDGNGRADGARGENETKNDGTCDEDTALLAIGDTLAKSTASVSSDENGARGGCTGGEPPYGIVRGLEPQPVVLRAVEEEPSEITVESMAVRVLAKAGVENDTDDDDGSRNDVPAALIRGNEEDATTETTGAAPHSHVGVEENDVEEDAIAVQLAEALSDLDDASKKYIDLKDAHVALEGSVGFLTAERDAALEDALRGRSQCDGMGKVMHHLKTNARKAALTRSELNCHVERLGEERDRLRRQCATTGHDRDRFKEERNRLGEMCRDLRVQSKGLTAEKERMTNVVEDLMTERAAVAAQVSEDDEDALSVRSEGNRHRRRRHVLGAMSCLDGMPLGPLRDSAGNADHHSQSSPGGSSLRRISIESVDDLERIMEEVRNWVESDAEGGGATSTDADITSGVAKKNPVRGLMITVGKRLSFAGGGAFGTATAADLGNARNAGPGKNITSTSGGGSKLWGNGAPDGLHGSRRGSWFRGGEDPDDNSRGEEIAGSIGDGGRGADDNDTNNYRDSNDAKNTIWRLGGVARQSSVRKRRHSGDKKRGRKRAGSKRGNWFGGGNDEDSTSNDDKGPNCCSVDESRAELGEGGHTAVDHENDAASVISNISQKEAHDDDEDAVGSEPQHRRRSWFGTTEGDDSDSDLKCSLRPVPAEAIDHDGDGLKKEAGEEADNSYSDRRLGVQNDDSLEEGSKEVTDPVATMTTALLLAETVEQGVHEGRRFKGGDKDGRDSAEGSHRDSSAKRLGEPIGEKREPRAEEDAIAATTPDAGGRRGNVWQQRGGWFGVKASDASDRLRDDAATKDEPSREGCIDAVAMSPTEVKDIMHDDDGSGDGASGNGHVKETVPGANGHRGRRRHGNKLGWFGGRENKDDVTVGSDNNEENGGNVDGNCGDSLEHGHDEDCDIVPDETSRQSRQEPGKRRGWFSGAEINNSGGGGSDRGMSKEEHHDGAGKENNGTDVAKNRDRPRWPGRGDDSGKSRRRPLHWFDSGREVEGKEGREEDATSTGKRESPQQDIGGTEHGRGWLGASRLGGRRQGGNAAENRNVHTNADNALAASDSESESEDKPRIAETQSLQSAQHGGENPSIHGASQDEKYLSFQEMKQTDNRRDGQPPAIIRGLLRGISSAHRQTASLDHTDTKAKDVLKLEKTNGVFGGGRGAPNGSRSSSELVNNGGNVLHKSFRGVMENVPWKPMNRTRQASYEDEESRCTPLLNNEAEKESSEEFTAPLPNSTAVMPTSCPSDSESNSDVSNYSDDSSCEREVLRYNHREKQPTNGRMRGSIGFL